MRRPLSALVIVVALLWAAHARADGTVALLPFDAEAKLELYGQPVASEIARALVAGAVDVVVVGPKMAVPERATLIVDGTIRADHGPAGKGEAVVLAIRVRNPSDGTVIEQLSATAASLSSIDRAAADLSGRLLPIVRARLAAAATRPAPSRPIEPARGVEPARTAPRPLLLAVGVGPAATRVVEPLRVALASAVPAWAGAHGRAASEVEPARLAKAAAAKTVATSDADRGILFEVLAYRVVERPVPMATARVRVRIAGADGVGFERVVVTDTVVGDRAMTPEALADRVAREVLAIMRPHVRRAVAPWR